MNAKNEFIMHVSRNFIQCAEVIIKQKKFINTRIETFITKSYLKEGFNIKDLEKFLKKIDHHYQNGFFYQEVFGTIWYNDGSCSQRTLVKECEFWQYNKYPEIPEYLKKES